MSRKLKTPKKKKLRSLKRKVKGTKVLTTNGYKKMLSGMKELIQQAQHESARAVNAMMTATYWEMGRRIVEVEQKGQRRSDYGERLIPKLAKDLSKSCGKGFGQRNLRNARQFYLTRSHFQKWQTVSAKSRKWQTVSAKSSKSLKIKDSSEFLLQLSHLFLLPWSAYVRLLSVKDTDARAFYEEEALRGGWSVRQLDRQINSQFYTRTLLSKNKVAMLTKGAKAKPEDKMLAEEIIKDPYVLEFLDLKDEYSEGELEEALIRHMESFILELGGSFAFVGRQKRLRIEDDWFRVDLVFYHRKLKCLILIDLKVRDFSYADAGQMNMYLNYAKKNWSEKGENPPIGLILCAGKKSTLAKYALEGMSNKIVAAKYRTQLPSTKLLTQEIKKSKRILELRKVKNKK